MPEVVSLQWDRIIELSILAFAMIAAFATAVVAFLTVRSHRAVFEAEFVRDSRISYFSEEMKEDLRVLSLFRVDSKGDPAGRYEELRLKFLSSEGSPEFEAVEIARRRVKNFFETGAVLRRERLISKRTFHLVTDFTGRELYHSIVVPLGLKLDPHWDIENSEFLRKNCRPINTTVSFVPPRSSSQ